MKKLKLEDLAVESFQTVEVARGAGTVRAHGITDFFAGPTCCPDCPSTDWQTCADTCHTCDGGYTCRPGDWGCP
jgi:hypothetical protein